MATHMIEGTSEAVQQVCPEKTALLRQHEDYCYQIAFYMLRNEGQALEAAKQALAALYSCPEWYKMPHKGRLAKAKQVTLIQSLENKKRGISRAL